jgi:hypothetical protein
LLIKYNSNNMKYLVILVSILLTLSNCKDPNFSEDPSLVISFKFDTTQTRLDNVGNPATIDAANAAQSPEFKTLGIHYIELVPTMYTALGAGAVIYKTTETTTGGDNAIDFAVETMVDAINNTIKIPLKDIKAGTYQYIRISLGYQLYNISARGDLSSFGLGNVDFPINLSSFLGFNSFIKSHKVKDSTFVINGNKKQGFWLGEIHTNFGTYPYHATLQGQNAQTTVTNPLFATSPIPAGSCVVTSDFSAASLTIDPNGTTSKNISVSVSINKSFEWKDNIKNGKWDVYPTAEPVVDMGVRGIVTKIN